MREKALEDSRGSLPVPVCCEKTELISNMKEGLDQTRASKKKRRKDSFSPLFSALIHGKCGLALTDLERHEVGRLGRRMDRRKFLRYF
jgi:hypothetical protein